MAGMHAFEFPIFYCAYDSAVATGSAPSRLSRRSEHVQNYRSHLSRCTSWVRWTQDLLALRSVSWQRKAITSQISNLSCVARNLHSQARNIRHHIHGPPLPTAFSSRYAPPICSQHNHSMHSLLKTDLLQRLVPQRALLCSCGYRAARFSRRNHTPADRFSCPQARPNAAREQPKGFSQILFSKRADF